MDASSFFAETLQPWSLGIKEAAHQIDGVLNGKLIGYRSGWANLDGMLRLVPGELTLVGARAGTGKTAFGMQLAENVMKQMVANRDEGLIVVFSAEMSSSALAKRTACGLAGVPVWKVDNGDITKAEGQRILEKLRELEAWPFVVDQTTAPTLEHMIDQMQV
jgi:replicative DNA helicase